MMQRKTTREYRLVDFHEKKEEMVLDFEGLEVGWYEGVLGLAMGNGLWLVTGFFCVKIVCLSLSLCGGFMYSWLRCLGHLGEVK